MNVDLVVSSGFGSTWCSDCNTNGQIDQCDIWQGSPDCNWN